MKKAVWNAENFVVKKNMFLDAFESTGNLIVFRDTRNLNAFRNTRNWFLFFWMVKLIMTPRPSPVRKLAIRIKRQKAVAEGKKKHVIEFSREMTSLRVNMKNLSKERKTKLINFLLKKGINLGKCNLLLDDYMNFINRYSAQEAAEAPFEVIPAKEERSALRQMKLLSSAVKQAREQGLF